MSYGQHEYARYMDSISEGNGNLTNDDYDEYDATEPEKLYHEGLDSRIKEKVYRRLVKTGLPRRPGFYKIQTLRCMAKPSEQYYTGKHWELTPQQGMNRGAKEVLEKPLERTTRRLTICAVNEASDEEQIRRTKNEQHEIQLAGRLLSPMNKEFKHIISVNREMQDKENVAMNQELLLEKDSVLAEMLHLANAKAVDSAMEEERQRRISIMSELTDEEMSSGDASFREMLRSLSKMSNIWHQIQDELITAVSDLEEVHEEEDHAVNDIFFEMKDDFILSFKRATLLMKFHIAEENERQWRLNQARLLCNGKMKPDLVQRRSSYMKDLTQQELVRVFNGVVMGDNEKEERESYLLDQQKGIVMEQMLRRHSVKEADHMCAEERARRIMEAEKELQKGAIRDSMKERLKDTMANVQEQMLLQIFRGHKVPQVAEPRGVRYTSHHEEEESERDRKLRTMRLQSRRKSCVVSGY